MSSRLSPSATLKVTSEPSFSTKVTLRSWPGLGGVRCACWVDWVVEKARDVVGVNARERVERMLVCCVCWDRTADWMYWPVLVERDGRRVREQVESALRPKRGV